MDNEFIENTPVLKLQTIRDKMRLNLIYPFLINVSEDRGNILEELIWDAKVNMDAYNVNKGKFTSPLFIGEKGAIDYFKISNANEEHKLDFMEKWVEHSKVINNYNKLTNKQNGASCIIVDSPYRYMHLDADIIDFLCEQKNFGSVDFVIFVSTYENSNALSVAMVDVKEACKLKEAIKI